MSAIHSPGISSDIPRLTPPGRIGVVGAGAFGHFCVQRYRESDDLEVVAIADQNPDALASLQIPGVRREQNYTALIADPSIEVLHIATPPFLRKEIVMAALTGGKSVFCEKPLALTLEDADAMIVAAERRGLALGVNYVMRHHPAYRMLETLASSGALGALRSFSFENFAQTMPPGHWFWDRQRSGGIFVEHGVHFFDALGRIAGPVEMVQGRQVRPETVEATIRYAHDVVGRFYHEFLFPKAVEYAGATVMFDRGHVRIEGWIPTRLSGAAMTKPEALSPLKLGSTSTDEGVTRWSLDYPDREGWYAAAISAGMRDVLHRHRDPTWRMIVSAQEARSSLALALAAEKAAGSACT